jgi:hypothetical protein
MQQLKQLNSWLNLYGAALRGRTSDEKQAIADHAELFSGELHDAALIRASHIIANVRLHTDEIRARVTRIKRLIRQIETEHARRAKTRNTEVTHDHAELA